MLPMYPALGYGLLYSFTARIIILQEAQKSASCSQSSLHQIWEYVNILPHMAKEMLKKRLNFSPLTVGWRRWLSS